MDNEQQTSSFSTLQYLLQLSYSENPDNQQKAGKQVVYLSQY